MAGEALFRKKVLAFLKDFDIEGKITITTIQNLSVRGVSDIILCVKGQFWAVELKGTDGVPSKLQTRYLEKISRSGGTSWELYPHKFEEFKQAIKEAVR